MTRRGVRDRIFQGNGHLHEPETLYENLYNENDDKAQLCIQKAIDSKNAWDQIHSNKKTQKIIIIWTIILSFSAILQALAGIFEKEINNRKLGLKIPLIGGIILILGIGIYLYRKKTKNT